ncbi:MAG: hypothetical protein ABJB47_10365 [Actinomycetota bacterium]
MFSHAGLAITGLAVWLVYFYVDIDRLAWLSVIILAAVAVLGLSMFTRWVPVHRLASERARAGMMASDQASPLPSLTSLPPERNFPASVVLLHGILAVVTITLVLLATLGVGGS